MPWPLLASLGLLAVAGLAYWPALAGGFLFDDFANLPALGHYGPVNDLPSLLRYLTSGIADPTGRPVSMLSFLIDSRDWPAAPWAFKRTNLAIHLLNSGLLLAVLSRLGAWRGLDPRHARMAAIGGASLWALHPLWVSTVAYVIQRHAMLPVTFVLAGVLAWVHGQQAFANGLPRHGWAWSLAAVLGCGLLAGLSKANGFLLPLLLMALQASILAPAGDARHQRRASTLLLMLPSALIVGMLAWKGVSGWHETFGRPWTLGERLITEPRVLLDYTRLLAVPGVHSPGLFADGFQASTGLFDPWSTLPALLLLAGTIVLAILQRRRWPAAAGAVLFFFAGHLLEGSSIPLELYFEHRNYLPALLLGWPIAIALTAPGKARAARIALLATAIATLAGLTFSRATLWGQPTALALSWARDLPESARAQTHAASTEIALGHPEMALARLRPLARTHPDEIQFALAMIDAECAATGQLSERTLGRAGDAIAATGVQKDFVHKWLRGKLEGVSVGCPQLDGTALATLVTNAHRHPAAGPMARNRLAQLDGLLALRTGRCESALRAFDRGLQHERHAAQILGQSAALASHCPPQLAVAHLERYRRQPLANDTPARPGMLRLHQALLRWQGYWESEMDRLAHTLRTEAGAKTPHDRDGRPGPGDAHEDAP